MRLAANPVDPVSVRSVASAEGLLGQAMGRFLALVENYPDLKASANMRQLSEELTSTENKVSFARQAYNDAVMTYNNLREEFPSNLVARWFLFEPAEPIVFIEDGAERAAPKVRF